jgi:hypothetical protein
MFKVESKKSKAETARAKIPPGLPATLDRSEIVRIVHVAWKKSFACVDMNNRAIAARIWRPINYILLYHPELKETKDRVGSIKEIYEHHVNYGVDIADLTSLNTDRGEICLTMDIFFNHKVNENALGQLSAVAKKEKRRKTGLAKKDGRAHVSASL